MSAKKQKKVPIHITDERAILLVHARAKAENRSYANAAAVTVIEQLSSKYTIKDSQSAR